MPEATIRQSRRPLHILTPLGDDVLGLRSIVVHEQLGRPFTIEAEFSSEDPDIDFNKIVGHAVTVRLALPTGEPRYWHAMVARFQLTGQAERFYHYRATLVPWVWVLSRSADCRIFQEQAVPDIVQAVFRDRASKDFEVRLSGTYEPWEYCVQYRETDLNFVSRLLEQEGITYYYKHDKDKGLLILADDHSSYEAVPGYEEIPFRGSRGAETRQEAIQDWVVEHELQPTRYGLSDYNPLDPKTSLLHVAEIPREFGANDREMFDYPGEHETVGDAERLARIRLEELHVGWQTLRARTSCMALGAGSLFKLADHPRAEQNREYLVTAVQLAFDAGEFDSNDNETRASCTFTAIPSDVPFRPQRSTPKPLIQGPHSAVVVGPSGEEIHTDEHGRVKVYFHWNREGKGDDTSSCWVRVAQGWAGKKWGSFFLPRIGHEVLVEFLEGDPDRPVITGSVYNKENAPPYPLPAEKTKSTLKSLSSKGGGGFNEIRYEDKAGSEEIYVHAQKDMNVDVLATRKANIGAEEHLTVTGNAFAHYKAENHIHVVGVQKSKHDADVEATIVGNKLEQVDANSSLTVAADRMVEIAGGDNLTVKGKLSIKSDGDVSIESGAKVHLKAGSPIGIEAPEIHIKAGQTLILEGGTQVSIKVGGNFVDVASAGVNVVGTMVGINSGGSAGSGGGCSPEAPAAPEAPSAPTDPAAPEKPKPGEVTEFSAAAKTLTFAAIAGIPFCEECNREPDEPGGEDPPPDEEIAVIESICVLDGDAELTSECDQFVNFASEDKWVDTDNGISSKSRLGDKVRFKVKFSAPGAHAFKVRLVPHDDNLAPSDAEKGRNAKFKYTEEEKSYTTDGDGTKIVETDISVSCIGLNSFHFEAEDTANSVIVESAPVVVRRLLYYVPVVMRGTTAPDMSAFHAEYERLGLHLVGYDVAEIEPMPNIGSSSDSSTYTSRMNTAFSASPGKDKTPHCLAVGFTGHLAVKNPSQQMPETVADASGPGSERVRVLVRAAPLNGGSIRSTSLWNDIVPGEGWFVSGEFIDSTGASHPITEALCATAGLVSNAADLRALDVDLTSFPAGGGTVKITAHVVDRWRLGLAMSAGNVLCVALRCRWKDIEVKSLNETLIHEVGHKVHMVCDGTGTLPDAPPTRYVERGHVGPHCHFGTALADNFNDVTSTPACVMFGSGGAPDSPGSFCEECSKAVRKMDLTAGIPA